ncbi:hypothetical protein KM043_004374 [Ampulex compressa]|nr:hypothetical protein KM043_004374 [Ampulex compressa]
MTAFGYIRRKSARTLQLLQSHAAHGPRIFARNESSFVPKRVLIVAKLSRYQFEKLREPDIDEAQLKLRLLDRGSDYDAMLASHLATKDVENQVTQILRKMNVEYRIVDRTSLDQLNFAWADLILPIGGDGTFLLASNLIFDNKKPIMGINSYPEKSEGFLMLPPRYTRNIPQIFEMLKAGHYGVLMRRRIRTTLRGEGIWKTTPFHMHEKGRVAGGERFHEYEEAASRMPNNLPKERRLPWLALNEVFMGESLSARTSSLLMKIDEEEKYHRVKSSGLCVSTGTGSTSWYKAINSLSPQTVQEILSLIDERNKFANDEIERICSSFNNSLQFDAQDLKLCYAIRDMIVTDVWPIPKCVHPRGFCQKLTVRSQCFDAGLVLDGGIAVPFNFGTTAVLETHPEDSLQTITLPN